VIQAKELLRRNVPSPEQCEADPRRCECGNPKHSRAAACNPCKRIEKELAAPPPHPAMIHLRRHGPATAKDVAEAIGYSTGAVAQCVTRASHRGLARRCGIGDHGAALWEVAR